jgi:mannose-1-phosphate guanylyltransferase
VRLRPLTLERPKPIVPLLNVPFLAYQLDLLRRHGITDVILSCSYMVDEVRRVMGDGAAWGVRLRYAVETEPLGTGGGVRNAVGLLDERVTSLGLVVVLNGDVLTDADVTAMLELHAARRAAASIYLFRVPDPTPYGLVELDPEARVTRFLEKPDPSEITTNTINAGIYVLERALLTRMPEGRVVSIEREFFPGLLADGVRVFGWVPDHYWLDIGNPEKYRQGQLDLMAGKVVAPIARSTPGHGAGVIEPSVVGAGTRLSPGARVGPDTVLGEQCTVGADALIEGAVLWDRVDVGAGAVLRDCIVATGSRIGARAVVGPGVVLGAGTTVPNGAEVRV